MKNSYLFILFLMYFGIVQAQNPFEKFGYEPKIGTLSKGKYIEHFDNDSIVRIGTVLFNTYTNTIDAFATKDTVYSEANVDPTIMSRWISPDPLADEFPDKSPYNFVNNNPIRYTDPLGLAPEDIVINTKDPTTGEYIETLRIISEKIDQTINLDVPTPLNVNPVTNSGNNMGPIVLNGLDNYLDKFEEILGQTDAVVISLSAGFAGGGGLGGQLDIVGFLNGEDAGGAFLYGNSDPSVNVGLGVGASIEVGGIYDRGDLSDFNRDTFENNTTKALSGGHGVAGASVFMGTYGIFDFSPNYIGFTATLGASPPTGVKYGGMLSVTKSNLKKTLVEPKKK